ncbi:MAG: nuclear transport factor 2 family protein [Rhodobacteraceae bacterium]|jgi:ketosteroid isomerase-like protein|nr:nuclear transport factor 2 family protein [Paracoccaceae bacterium]
MRQDATLFSGEWEAGWNSHDLDRILSHYREDVVFRSRKAIALVGSGEVVGKERLRNYWSAALQRQPDLRFAVEDVFEGHEMLVITYRNHRGVLAAETLYFDETGLVFRAAACHRATAD